MSAFDDLARRVSDNGGILSMQMSEFLELYEQHINGKLRKSEKEIVGCALRSSLSEVLQSFGLIYYPLHKPMQWAHDEERICGLPADPKQMIRLVKIGSPMDRLMDTILNPSQNNDHFLINSMSVRGNDVLEQIRKIVNE